MSQVPVEVRERQLWQGALESDIGIAAYLAHTGIDAPVVRASVYGGGVAPYQEIAGWEINIRNDPRRPVVMQGSLWSLCAKYALSQHFVGHGWAIRVIMRYLRTTNYTCGDRVQHLISISKLVGRLRERGRYHLGQNAFDVVCNRIPEIVEGMVWYQGSYTKRTQACLAEALAATAAARLAAQRAAQQVSHTPPRLTRASRVRRVPAIPRAATPARSSAVLTGEAASASIDHALAELGF